MLSRPVRTKRPGLRRACIHEHILREKCCRTRCSADGGRGGAVIGCPHGPNRRNGRRAGRRQPRPSGRQSPEQPSRGTATVVRGNEFTSLCQSSSVLSNINEGVRMSGWKLAGGALASGGWPASTPAAQITYRLDRPSSRDVRLLLDATSDARGMNGDVVLRECSIEVSKTHREKPQPLRLRST